MKLNKKEVAQNLRLFGYKRFGTMKKYAEALDMNPSTLYSGYLNGRSLPGPVLLVKLIDLGCNINWLLTNRETPFTNEIHDLSKKNDDHSLSLLNSMPRPNATPNRLIDSKNNIVSFAEHRR